MRDCIEVFLRRVYTFLFGKNKKQENPFSGYIQTLNRKGYEVRLDESGVWVLSDQLSIVGKSVVNTFWTSIGVLCKEEYCFAGLGEHYVVIDIGLNIGLTTLYLALKPEVVHVYGYEPFYETFIQAENNLRLNPSLKDKISIFNYGLSDTTEIKTFNYSKDFPGSMSTVVNKFPDNGKLEKVELKNASEVLRPIFEHHSETMMLKIDCEGGENEIIPDLMASGLLRKIKIIIMEWHFEPPAKWIKLFNDNGFIVFCDHEIVNYQGIIRAVNIC
ncbi:hypothetical protein FACS1894182_06670 [Bacteroidia bacterium]|nr:hypothetical protein FACS1894182_06670 [Bacteroidia bacterium]